MPTLSPLQMFREIKGVWTWPFYQIYTPGTKPGQLVKVEGPGPRMAVKLGYKYNRIRQSVPYGLVRGVELAPGIAEVADQAGYDLMVRAGPSK